MEGEERGGGKEKGRENWESQRKGKREKSQTKPM